MLLRLAGKHHDNLSILYIYMMIKSIQIDRASQSEFAIDST